MDSNQICLGDCLPRYYSSVQTFSCQRCPYDCYTCDSYGQCLTCDDSVDFRVFFRDIGRCLPLPGYYDNLSQICLPCPLGCLLCQSETYCLSCNTGFFLDLDFMCTASCPAHYFGDTSSLLCVPCPYDCLNCD
jgi:hypothetical protein